MISPIEECTKTDCIHKDHILTTCKYMCIGYEKKIQCINKEKKMIKQIKVTCCNECPYVTWDEDRKKTYCHFSTFEEFCIDRAIEKHIINCKCPLEDYVDQRSKPLLCACHHCDAETSAYIEKADYKYKDIIVPNIPQVFCSKCNKVAGLHASSTKLIADYITSNKSKVTK